MPVLPKGDISFPVAPNTPTILVVPIGRRELRVALITREALKNKDTQALMSKTGIYLLLGYFDESKEKYEAYVGESGGQFGKNVKSTVVARVKDHNRDLDKLWWKRAILITRKGEDTPTSTIIEAEKVLIEEFRTFKYAEVRNKISGKNVESTSAESEEAKDFQETARVALWIYGYNTEVGKKTSTSTSTFTTEPSSTSTPRPKPSPQPKPSPIPGMPSSARGVRLKHLFRDGYLSNGDQLKFVHVSYDPKIEIVEGGNLIVEGVSGQFNSPVKAFQAFRKSINERGDSGYGGHWNNWDVISSEGKSERLLKLRNRYCRENNIPISGQATTPQGIPQSSTSASPTTDKGKTQNKSVSIPNLIGHGHLTKGERLYPNHRTARERGYTALLTTDGEIKPVGPGFSGETYSSPSGAGVAILRQIGRPSTCDGWEFWMRRLSDGSFEKLKEVRERSKQQPEKQQPEPKNPNKKVTPLDLINGGLLEIGERLYPNHREAKERGYSAVLTADGKMRPDGPGFFGETYSSPSSAGKAVIDKITKVKSIGGWEFWTRKRRDGSFEKLAEVRERFLKQNR